MKWRKITFNSTFFYSLILLLGLTACKDITVNSKGLITKFSFLHKNNPSLVSDIEFEIIDQKIKGSVPINVSLEGLVATFEYTGVRVKIASMTQESGKTSNNFKDILKYSVSNKDGVVSTYAVDIDRFTGLPLIFITTEENALIDSKKEYKKGNIKIIDEKGDRNLDVKMEIRGRGNSTWGNPPKKPYQIKLSGKAEVLGMPSNKKWIFLAEHSDKTLLRNRIAFELGYLSGLDWTPSSVFAEVVINNQYNGTYHITQKIEESKNRVNIGSSGYLLEIDQLRRLNPEDVYFKTSKFLINIKEPKVVKNDVEYNYITEYIKDFETALYSSDFKDPDLGYARYIDINSFIDWYLINEISKNQDAKSFSSIYMNLKPGEKLKMGPIWDFDISFGNIDFSSAEHPEGFWINKNPWLKRMFEDQSFANKVKERFSFYRKNEAYIMHIIDMYAAKLYRSQYENDKVWQTMGVYVWPNSKWFDTYGEEVDYLKKWISIRMDWLDTNL